MPELVNDGVPPRLFVDFVKATKFLEENYFLYPSYGYHKFSDMDLEMKIKVVKEMQQAAADELFELLGEVSWKPWASATFLHRDAVISEAVDALHFIGIILAVCECSDAELARKYREKMERNRQRMLEGYTGTDKCNNCRRAFDDLDTLYPANAGYRLVRDIDGKELTYCCVCVVELKLKTEEEVLESVALKRALRR